MRRSAPPLRTLGYLSTWLVPWRPVFRTRARQSGLAFFVHRRDAIGRHIAKYGGHEPLLTQWIAERLATSPRGLFVDVGANLGWHAVHAARHEAVETVVAFEPDAFNAWLLDRNLVENGIDKVVVDTRAVGARPSLARLRAYKGSNRGRHSLLADYGYGSRTVLVTDLDSALAAFALADRRVLILKIDVEGFEPAVIAGARKTLARTDVVIIEYSPHLSRSGGLEPDAMLDSLHEAGFAPHRLAADGRLAPLAGDDMRRIVDQVDLIWVRASAT